MALALCRFGRESHCAAATHVRAWHWPDPLWPSKIAAIFLDSDQTSSAEHFSFEKPSRPISFLKVIAMKTLIVGVTLGVALAGFSQGVLAGCSTGRVNEPALTTLLRDNTVCVPPVTVATMQWQELHQSGGKLIDYKRGPSDKVDPSAEVGSWTVTGSNRGAFVTHDYGHGHVYTYSVFNNGDGTHSFCSGGAEIKARIKLGGGPC